MAANPEQIRDLAWPHSAALAVEAESRKAERELLRKEVRFCQVSRQTRVRVLPIMAVGREAPHHLGPIARFGARPDRTGRIAPLRAQAMKSPVRRV